MKKPLSEAPKGTRDFLPSEMRKRNYVIGVIREVYESYGFEPLETPCFERLETLLGKYGEEGDQLVFKILHRGQALVDGIREASDHLQRDGVIVTGRSGETAPSAEKLLSDLGLRYDLTVPLARVFAAHQGALPPVFKRYQIAPVWRADTPGKGRFREFLQCDVDVVGAKSLVVEVELVSAISEALHRLGFTEFRIRLNHRALLRAIVEVAGIPLEHETAAIVAIDKLDKLPPEKVQAEMLSHGIAAESAAKLVTELTRHGGLARGMGRAVVHARSTAPLHGADAPIEGDGPDRSNDLLSSFVAAYLDGHAAGTAALDELRVLLALAQDTPAAAHLRFDLSLARGLGYYTGAIFEIQVDGLAGSMGGGGRYDGLIGMFAGRDAPACGFSLGLERILLVMEERGLFPPEVTGAAVDAVVGAADETGLPAALALAAQLRAQGKRIELRPKADSPGKLRKYADERRIPLALWIERDGKVAGFRTGEAGGPFDPTDLSAVVSPKL